MALLQKFLTAFRALNLQLSPSVETSSIDGSVEVTVETKGKTTYIVLHAEQLVIMDVFVTKVSTNQTLEVLKLAVDTKTSFLNITLAASLESGVQCNVRIKYSALINSQPVGLFSASYEENGQNKTILATNVYPIYARRIFPCFDEPHLRATYSVQVRRSAQQKVLFNTGRSQTSDNPDGSSWDVFEKTSPLATHHFALVIHSDLIETQIDFKNSIWTRPSTTSKAAFAAKVIPQIMMSATDYFGTDVPHKKINVVAIPAKIGTPTGTWSLLISSESRVLAGEDIKEPAHTRVLVAQTLALSLLEQFIGNIVTPAWWSEVALKDGLPNLLKYTVKDIFKEDGLYEGMDLQLALEEDGLESTTPIQNYVEAPDDIVKHVSASTGTHLFSMLRAVLGKNVFRQGIQAYLKEKHFKSASIEEFIQILQATADKNDINLPRGAKIKDIVDSWKGEAGYPLITALSNPQDWTIEVSQERYFSHSPTNSFNLSDQQWVVPLIREVENMGTELVDILLPTDRQREVPFTFTPSIFNTRRGGRMRVNYDPATWLSLSWRLSEINGTLPNEDRIALRDDALALARTGHLEYPVALEVLPSLANEDISVSIYGSARLSLRHLEGLLYNSPTYERYKTYMLGLLKKALQNVGWVANSTENDNFRITRSILISWACELDESGSLLHAQLLFARWKADPEGIQKDALQAIICAGLKDGAPDDVNYVLSFFLNSQDEYERRVIASSIGCYGYNPIILQILDQAANLKGFTADEAYTTFLSAASHRHVLQVLTYLSSKYATVQESLGVNLAERMVLNVANLIRDKTNYEKLRQLVHGEKSLVLQEALALAGDNLRWQKAYLPQVSSWIASKLPGGPGPPTTPTPSPPPTIPTPSPPPTPTPSPPPTTPTPSPPPTTSTSSTLPSTTTTSTPPPTEPEPPSAGKYRLNTDLYPQTYILRLVPYVRNSSIQGSVNILFRVNRATNVITLNAVDLKISEAKLKKSGTSNFEEILSVHTDQVHQLLHIKAASSLVLFSEYTLTLVYEGKIRNDLLGFHSISVSDTSEEKYVLSTQFSPVYARSAFPCWDEPRFRATFTLLIARQTTERTFSNTRFEATSGPDPTIEDRVWDKYETTPQLPAYLIGFQVWSDPPKEAKQANISVWTRADRSGDTTQVLVDANLLISYLEAHTDQNSDLMKLDIVGVPDHNFQAMENWGINTFRENILLLNKKTGVEMVQRSALVLAHEIAHQWFGNLVTIDWWNNAWLKEGLSSLYEYLCVQNITDGEKWNMEDQFVVRVVQPALQDDSSLKSHALSGPVKKPQDALAHLDSITYKKGAAVISMLRNAISPEIFREALVHYIKKKKYMNATPTDLWKAIQWSIEENNQNVLPPGIPLSVIMNDWVELPGYPIVNVKRDTQKSQVIVTQEPITPTVKRVFNSWFIPINLQLSTNKEDITYHWLLRNKPLIINDVPSSSPWVVANADRKGFFRVNYSPENWKALLSYLRVSKFRDFSSATRATLIDDALSLARLGRLDYDIALRILEYLSEETEYAPLSAARQSLEFIESILSGTEAGQYYKKIMKPKFGFIYNRIEWTSKPSDNHELKLKRALIVPWVCRRTWWSCENEPYIEFKKWKENSDSPSDEVLEATICTALTDDWPNKDDVERIVSVMSQERNDVRRNAYCRALGCLEDERHAIHVLRMTITDERFKPKDAVQVYAGISFKSKHHANVVLEFLRSNLKQVISVLGRHSLEEVLLNLAHRLSEQAHLKSLTDIVTTLEKTTQSLKGREALVILESNIVWMKNSYDSVEKTLKNIWDPEPSTPTSRPPTTSPSTSPSTTSPSTTSPSTTTTVPTEPPKSDDYRLNTDLNPLEYNLEIVPNVQTSSFTGTVQILFGVNRPIKVITINAFDLNIKEVKWQKKGSSDWEEIDSFSTDQDRQFVHIRTRSELSQFSEYSILVKYEGKIRNDLLGLHMIKASDSSAEKYVLSTQFSSGFARSVFPCWDEPRFRSTFTLSIGRKPTERTLSNTELESTVDSLIEGLSWDKYKTTKRIPAYLFGFHVFSEPPSENKKSPITVWTLADHTRESIRAVFVAELLYTHFENYTGVKSDLSKMDLVGVPEHYFPATESWGLNTFRENLLLLNEQTLGVKALQNQAVALAHAIGHQWFGNLVTIDWWNNAWLKDGLATLIGYQAIQFTDIGKSWFIPDQFAVSVIQAGLHHDTLNGSQALLMPIIKPQDGLADADSITYNKGAAVLSMLKYAVTPEIFRHGLVLYLVNKKYQNATPSDLWEEIQKVIETKKLPEPVLPTGVDLSTIMKDWTDESGYPILNVNYESKKNQITITQEPSKYTENGKKPAWYVPITLQVSVDKTKIRSHWLLRDKPLVIGSVPKDSPWIVANANRRGFFRVNYNKKNWKSILSQLVWGKFRVFSSATRASLIDDALSLARLGRLDYNIALRILELLAVETEFAPLSAARQSLEFLDSILSGTQAGEYYKKYMNNSLGKIFDRIEWRTLPRDGHELRMKRALITPWACRWYSCRSNALPEFENWKKNNDDTSDEVLEATICYSLSDIENSHELEGVVSVMSQERNDVRRNAYRRALGCVEQDEDANKILEMTINDKRLKPEDAVHIYAGVTIKSKRRANIFLEFLQSNLLRVISVVGRSSVEDVVMSLAHRLSEQQHLKSLTNIVQTLERTTQSLKGREALSILESNIFWMKNSYVTVEKALKDILGPAPTASPSTQPN